jgi:hypothetical protein
MLVDPEFINWFGPDADKYIPTPIRPGMYADSYFIRNMCSVELIEYDWQRVDHLPREQQLRALMDLYDSPDHLPDFGTCDDDEQFLRRFPHILTSEKKYFVVFSVHDKKDEPPIGGFRFHKNGQYYGEQECEGYEYFVDEPHMETVCSFAILELTDRVNQRIPRNTEGVVLRTMDK